MLSAARLRNAGASSLSGGAGRGAFYSSPMLASLKRRIPTPGTCQPGSPRRGAVANSRMPSSKPTVGSQPSSVLISSEDAVM